jgi:hypothetical protein
MKPVSLFSLSHEHHRDQLVARVRAKLCQPNADVRLRGTNVEVFGYPPNTASPTPQWYFVGTAKDFPPKQDHHQDTTIKGHRLIHQIARDIRLYWPKVHYAAEPYLAAMETLYTIDQNYIHESARSIINYFLANANTFRGEQARRIKAELNAMLK